MLYPVLTIGKALLRKIDWKIMAWAAFGFSTLDWDRINIIQANSTSFLTDLHMTTNGESRQTSTLLKVPNELLTFLGLDFNMGNTIFSLSFLCAELPSQMISKRVCQSHA